MIVKLLCFMIEFDEHVVLDAPGQKDTADACEIH